MPLPDALTVPHGPPLMALAACCCLPHSLEGRLASLERRLEQLDDGAKEVVQQSVAGWVGAAVGGSGEGSAGGGLGEGGTT